MKNFMKALAAWSLSLVACGLKLAACRLNLFTRNSNACSLMLAACRLKLAACSLWLVADGLWPRTCFQALVGNVRYIRGHVSVYHMQRLERTCPNTPYSLSIYYPAQLLDMSCFQLLRWRYKARKSAGYRRL